MTDRELAKRLHIGTNTKLAYPAWRRTEQMLNVEVQICMASRGIEWAISTGRLPAAVEMWLLGLSAYQQIKVLNHIITTGCTMNDTPRALIAHHEREA